MLRYTDFLLESLLLESVVYYSDKFIKIDKDVKVFQDLPIDDVFIITGQKLYRISLIGNNFSFELIVHKYN